ncbi:hypothetical protein PCE1_001790 [Barthelona sp. PCE]
MGRTKRPTVVSKDRGFTFTKAFGQHILKHADVARKIVDSANLSNTDIVLEIGPGTGALTQFIAPRVRKLEIVEYDPRMVQEIRKRFRSEINDRRMYITQGDAVKVEFPFFDVCISNTPYEISSPLVFKLLAHKPTFRCAVLMFQREFALRLMAQPGDALYGRLSVNTQLLAKVVPVMKVPKSHFDPPPKVESMVVRIEPFCPAPDINFIEWDGLVRICFNRKNKKLSSVFNNRSVMKVLEHNHLTYCSLHNEEPWDGDFTEFVLSILRDTVTETIDKHGNVIERSVAEARAVQMTIDDYLALLIQFNEHNIHFA